MNEKKESFEAIEIWTPEEQGTEKTELLTALTGTKKSVLRKYQDIVVGTQGIPHLLKYEILTTLFGPLPGAAGLVLRKRCFKKLLRHVGKVVRGINIEDNCLLGAGVMVQDGVTIGKDSTIRTNAVVTKSIPDFNVAVGVPAEVIKKRSN